MPDRTLQTEEPRLSEASLPDFFRKLQLLEEERQEELRRQEEPQPPPEDAAKEPPEPEPDPLEQALEQADLIIKTAQNQAEDIRKQAYQEGYQAGEEAGRVDGRQEACEEHSRHLRELRTRTEDRLEEYFREVSRAKDKILEEYVDDLKNIALTVGEKIVHTSLRSSSEVVKNMILNATSKLEQTAWAKIYVAEGEDGNMKEIQGDAAFLRELSRISSNVKVVLMDDADPGTCIIELPQEVMDISVSTQLENIKEILNNARL